MSQGYITQIIGAVINVAFEDELPKIHEALIVDEANLTLEVQQHLGDKQVKCIAMGLSEGLKRNMKVTATGKGITVPTGEKTLGRIMNVLGEPIDELGPIESNERREIHQEAPKFDELSKENTLLITGIKVVDLF